MVSGFDSEGSRPKLWRPMSRGSVVTMVCKLFAAERVGELSDVGLVVFVHEFTMPVVVEWRWWCCK